MKPKFEERLPDPMYLFRGRTGGIPCNPTGGPIPKKTWFKNNFRIDVSKPGGRITQHANGTLVINKVQDSDQGIYKCVAENSKGRDETSSRVRVVSKYCIFSLMQRAEV